VTERFEPIGRFYVQRKHIKRVKKIFNLFFNLVCSNKPSASLNT